MSTAVLTAVAWAYRNGARHIGHKSGSGVASGVFAPCHRMAGNRVLTVSGTDEPQGLPEVDARFASGESVVSFQRPSIADGAQPLGQRTRLADAGAAPALGRLVLDAAVRKLACVRAEEREIEKSLGQEMASAAVSQGGTGRATIGPKTAGPSGPGGGEGQRPFDALHPRVQDRPRTVFA